MSIKDIFGTKISKEFSIEMLAEETIKKLDQADAFRKKYEDILKSIYALPHGQKGDEWYWHGTHCQGGEEEFNKREKLKAFA